MPICHKHKFVFIHIPKTGGTTIEKLFNLHGYENAGDNNILNTDIMWGQGTQHLTYTKLVSDASRDISGYFSFAFVRNPWDRMVSEFFWRRRDSKRLHKRNLNQFLRRIHKYRWCTEHFHPQSKFVCDKDENCQVDFIGKYENFQEDFNIVCDRIGIPRQELPHLNATKHKHYTEYYDDETRQIVAEKYAKDIEYFGYKFGE